MIKNLRHGSAGPKKSCRWLQLFKVMILKSTFLAICTKHKRKEKKNFIYKKTYTCAKFCRIY